MSVIMIYEGIHGAEEVANRVAKSLNYKCVGRQDLAATLPHYGVPRAKLDDITEKEPHWWEQWLQEPRIHGASEPEEFMRNICGVICGLFFVVSANAAEFMGVPIVPENRSQTYRRSDWKHWTDADGDRIRTRDEVLILESLVIVTVDGNKVKAGLWVGPYTGLVSMNTGDFQIDHMVPLKEAHESGGHTWTPAMKESYANDLSNPQHLIAVKNGSNGSKGFKDPAEWMPPNRSYWCTYLADWVEIKRRWKLTMDQSEADAIGKGLKVCKRYKSGDHLDGRH